MHVCSKVARRFLHVLRTYVLRSHAAHASACSCAQTEDKKRGSCLLLLFSIARLVRLDVAVETCILVFSFVCQDGKLHHEVILTVPRFTKECWGRGGGGGGRRRRVLGSFFTAGGHVGG